MIDCHAHTYAPYFDHQHLLNDVLPCAHAAGVTDIVAVAESTTTAASLLQLHEAIANAHNQLPTLRLGLGLHPVQHCSAGRPISAVAADLPAMVDLIRQHATTLTCVGEIGLDFSPHVLRNTDAPPDVQKEEQRLVLRQQLALANDLDLPVNVHSRNAGHHVIAELVQCNVQRALLHAFDGRPVHALRAVQAGYCFSIPPSVARSEGFQKLLAALPLDCLVLESDAPALGPVAGETNVPANVAVCVEHIARVKGVKVEDVVQLTTENAQRLFPRIRC